MRSQLAMLKINSQQYLATAHEKLENDPTIDSLICSMFEEAYTIFSCQTLSSL